MSLRTAALAAAVLAAAEPVPARAAPEEKPVVNVALSVRDLLVANTGKKVALRLSGGEALEGTVTKVGDHVVHVSALAGKEYYDAVVVIDRIEAVIFRAK